MKHAALTAIALAGLLEGAHGAISPPATVTNVQVRPIFITVHPTNQTVFSGETATFTVEANSIYLPVSYQWTFNGLPVVGNNKTYIRTDCQPVDNGGRVQVTVVAPDGGLSVQSREAVLTVADRPTLEFVAQPEGNTVSVGESATFMVTAQLSGFTGGLTPEFHYQWMFNGASVGGDSNSYTRTNCQLVDSSSRVQVLVTVGNFPASGYSDPATLTVLPSGVVYYVSPNGSSRNNGGSGDPWPLQYAMDRAVANSTVIVMDGLYIGPFGFNGADHVTVMAQHKWKAVIANSASTGIYANSYSSSGGVYMSDHITFDGLCVSNNATDGIAINNHCVVRNCWILNNRQNGINASAHSCSNNVIEYNLIENNDLVGTSFCHGMYIAGPNHIIRGNVVRDDVAGYGIHVYTSGTGTLQMNNIQIYNNLTYGNGAFGVTVWGANGDNGALPGTNYVFGNTILDGFQMAYGGLNITNNIVLPGPLSSSPMVVQGGRTVYGKADYNLGTSPMYFSGKHDVITNYAAIGFVDANRGLYWIASNSAARAKASSGVCGPVDFFGNAQASVKDIGAFQYNAALTNDTRILDRSQGGSDYWRLR